MNIILIEFLFLLSFFAFMYVDIILLSKNFTTHCMFRGEKKRHECWNAGKNEVCASIFDSVAN